MEENQCDPTMPMPITLLISFPPPNDYPIQTATTDHSQPTPFEPNNLNSSSPQDPQSLTEPRVTDSGEDLCLEKPIKVYSRRAKHPAPQLSQSLEPRGGPTNEEESTAANNDLNIPIALRKEGNVMC